MLDNPKSAQRISVIIRTIGRPELAQAVASVCAQSGFRRRPVIELVIVNAAQTMLPHFAVPDVSVREVRGGRSLNRPEAANAGLDAATGDHLCFLDDDDWFHPDHLASLLDALSRHPQSRVAYSGALLVQADGRPYGRLNRPFDRGALLRANYIQMGAALFHRSLLAEGARFDETLLNFQDWDFWLQLADRTDFVHTGRTTLSWRAFSGGSGSGMGANANAAVQASYTERVQRKWMRMLSRRAATRDGALAT
ncbi:MAG: glycosyltransferase [Betaproteobacteria bacterium]|nr:glycosyltransferase [Betaproteobacteria bacterium]